ncbi:unnamed protein product [Victoria cruziana]
MTSTVLRRLYILITDNVACSSLKLYLPQLLPVSVLNLRSRSPRVSVLIQSLFPLLRDVSCSADGMHSSRAYR